MLDKCGQKTHAKLLHGATRFVAGFVLVEAPVWVSRRLANVKTNAATPSRIVQ
jgi:hypothetical protein